MGEEKAAEECLRREPSGGTALHSQRGTDRGLNALGERAVLCVEPKLQIYILERKAD